MRERENEEGKEREGEITESAHATGGSCSAVGVWQSASSQSATPSPPEPLGCT